MAGAATPRTSPGERSERRREYAHRGQDRQTGNVAGLCPCTPTILRIVQGHRPQTPYLVRPAETPQPGRVSRYGPYSAPARRAPIRFTMCITVGPAGEVGWVKRRAHHSPSASNRSLTLLLTRKSSM